VQPSVYWAEWPIPQDPSEGTPTTNQTHASQQIVLADHRFNYDHHIKFHNTRILGSKPDYTDQLIRKMTELELHTDFMNREDGRILSGSWKTLS
jgi:hypothetical protein